MPLLSDMLLIRDDSEAAVPGKRIEDCCNFDRKILHLNNSTFFVLILKMGVTIVYDKLNTHTYKCVSFDSTLTEENCYGTYRRWVVVGVNRALTYTIGSFGGRAQNIIYLVVNLSPRQKVLRIEDAHASAFWSDNDLLLWLTLIRRSELALHLLGVRLGNWNHCFVVFLLQLQLHLLDGTN